jgi:hypothetical protein
MYDKHVERVAIFSLGRWHEPPIVWIGQTGEQRSRALDLAGAQIDKLSDPSASDEERQQRKRRLLKGPHEFREMRDEIRSKSKS